jgi:hypothetical protein
MDSHFAPHSPLVTPPSIPRSRRAFDNAQIQLDAVINQAKIAHET